MKGFSDVRNRIERLERNLKEQKADFEQRISNQLDEARYREKALTQQIAELRVDYQAQINELKKELENRIQAVSQAQTEAAELRGRLSVLSDNLSNRAVGKE